LPYWSFILLDNQIQLLNDPAGKNIMY